MKLNDVIEALYMANDTSRAFYDLTTQKIEWLNEFSMTSEEYGEAADTLDEHGFKRLPEQRDINVYGMMEDFAYEYKSWELQQAIIGRGAFRRFKATVRHLGLEQEWYRYRDAQYKSVALAWCEECGIELEAD